MKIITISREFGSGGRELGKRLAEELNFDYYDSEIIVGVSEKSGLDASFVSETLDSFGQDGRTLTFSRTLSTPFRLETSKISLLLKQKEVIEAIAKKGRDCVIVGRNADVILKDYNPFNIFVCADRDSKIKRCLQRTGENENLTERELVRKMKQVDTVRARTREMISGSSWGKPDEYHLTVNTTGFEIKELVSPLTAYIVNFFGRTK